LIFLLLLNISLLAKPLETNNFSGNQFKDQWCNYLKDKSLTYKDFRKFFSTSRSFHQGRLKLDSKRFASANCKLISEEPSNFPLHILKYSSGNATYLILLEYSKESKITSFSLINVPDQINARSELLLMPDGIRLQTISLYFNNNTQRGTVFLKTPYQKINQSAYFNQAATLFIKNGFNFVLQANRGSYLSEGHFQWMNPQGVKDSYETIEWITKQNFSNQKVMSFGISYDGYNALAANASAHKALKATVACSAPANSNTDSFTANKRVKASLLNFIAVREGHSPFEKEILTHNGPLEELDNLIYGKDIFDWNHIVEAASNENSSFWKDRNLLEKLEKSQIPTVHIAGLVRDQDARDTILAYQHIQKHGQYPDRHKLFLHPGSHGCGTFFSSKNLGQYLSLISDNPAKELTQAKVTQYFRKQSSYKTGDHFPLSHFTKKTNFLLKAENEDRSTSKTRVLGRLKNLKEKEANQKKLTLSVVLKRDIYINGMPEVHFSSFSDTPDARVSVMITYASLGRTLSQSLKHELLLSRSSIQINNHKVNRITYPPQYGMLKKGTKIFITLTTKENNELNPNTFFQQEFFNENEYGYTDILKGATLVLPEEI